MRRGLVIVLFVLVVLSCGCTAFAGPFADVPANHWAYAAISKLESAGIIDGVAAGQFQGDKLVTRYEMAQIVAKAIENSKRADAENNVLINKLAVEFAQELKTLGVRVSALETKVDNVKFTGEVRMRYTNLDANNKKSDENSNSYLDLWVNARINDTWVAKAELESVKGQDGSGADNQGNATKIFATGPACGGTLTLGKFDPFGAYGLVIDDNISGGMYEFGKKFKTRLAFGKLNAGTLGSPHIDFDSDARYIDNAAGSKYTLAEMGYAISPTTNIKAAYHSVGLTAAAQNSTIISDLDKNVSYYEGGFDSKIGANWGFLATASKSDIDVVGQDNKGYFAQLQYKAAVKDKPGSYGVFYNYRKIPTLSEIDSTWDYSHGIKGNQVGVEYVPMINSKITAFYLNGKLVDNDKAIKVYRAQVEFLF
ncbi:MAG: S-layer protein [Firmicutes bacterium]|nr:S-layer protein [Bacillota bacterium]